jgi:hypothetical protein
MAYLLLDIDKEATTNYLGTRMKYIAHLSRKIYTRPGSHQIRFTKHHHPYF